jgi:fructokinase
MKERYLVVGLGELLWDLFPDRGGRRLGGAPANVAYHSAVLGDHGVVASRVGTDEPGREALQALEQRGVETCLIQLDTGRPTGTARVTLGSGPEPAFEIDATAAWTAPVWTQQWEAAIRRADVLCFGTLLCSMPAGRDLVERATAAVPDHALRVLDLNLRPPFDRPEAIDAALACADIVKLSEEELDTLGKLRGVADAAAHLLSSRSRVRAVAVTRGPRGSLLYTEEGQDEHPGHAIDDPERGHDPVGAGDAFTAALVHHLVRGHAPGRANAAANRYASFVASRAGAMPDLPEQLRREVVQPRAGPETDAASGQETR